MSEAPMNDRESLPKSAKVKNYDKRRKIVGFGVVPILFLVSLIIAIPVPFFLSDPTDIPIQVGVGVSLAAEIIALLWALWWAGLLPLREMIYFRVNKLWHLALGVGAGLGSYVMLQLVAYGAHLITGEAVESSETSKQIGELTGAGGVIFLVLFVAILAPFFEELYFRGVVLGSFMHSSLNKPWLAIVVSAVSFGIMHIQGFSSVTDFVVLLWITIMGAGFAALVLWTKSVWTSVAAHVTYNGITAVLLVIGILAS